MLGSKNAKICVTPDGSQWNIGGVGSSGIGARHVHFMLFVLISFALGKQRKHVFSGIWALSLYSTATTIGLDTQRHNFGLPTPTCWYLKALKFAFSPTPNLKFVLPPTRTPNASQWNIGCVGSPTQNFRVGNVHFIFFCVDFNTNPVSSGIWALLLRLGYSIVAHVCYV